MFLALFELSLTVNTVITGQWHLHDDKLEITSDIWVDH